MDSQQTRPSKGRWYILFLICLMYLITYLDRVCIAVAGPRMQEALQLLMGTQPQHLFTSPCHILGTEIRMNCVEK